MGCSSKSILMVFHACMYAVASVVSTSFVTSETVALQVPLPMGFSRQEYWSGLPCPPPGNLPDPWIEPASLMSPALASRFFLFFFVFFCFFITSITWEAPLMVLGWPKSLFGFFCKMLWKNLSKSFGQSNICLL